MASKGLSGIAFACGFVHGALSGLESMLNDEASHGT